MEVRTHVILDGLQDPLHGRELSARWAAAGLNNAVDVAGQAAWIELGEEGHEGTEARRHGGGEEQEQQKQQQEQSAHATTRNSKPETRNSSSDPTPHTLNPTPHSLLRAAAIARAFGVELRERVGNTFKADNDLPALREQMTREYRARFAQSLVFGLPALVIHYLGPMLASGGGQSAGSMAFAWLLEMVLVGWAIWVAALPIVWQGVWSLIHLRPTADLLTTLILLVAYLPSAIGVTSLLFTDDPWFGITGGPAFHIAIMAVMLATCQRWRMHTYIDALAGRANHMMRHHASLIAVWLAAMFLVCIFSGWQVALAFGLLLPPMISSGAINRMTPGWAMALPVLAFGPVFVLGIKSLPLAMHAQSRRFEIAMGFGWMMVIVMEMGWRRMERKSPESGVQSPESV